MALDEDTRKQQSEKANIEKGYKFDMYISFRLRLHNSSTNPYNYDQNHYNDNYGDDNDNVIKVKYSISKHDRIDAAEKVDLDVACQIQFFINNIRR